MTNGKTRGRASPLEFVTVSRFMMGELALTGIPLLVYARIFGFEVRGEGFYESKSSLARFLNTTERSVYRAFAELSEKNLVLEAGDAEAPSGRRTKLYLINWEKVPEDVTLALRGRRSSDPDDSSPDETSGVPPPMPDKTSGKGPPIPDETSGASVTKRHPIRKTDNKGFR